MRGWRKLLADPAREKNEKSSVVSRVHRNSIKPRPAERIVRQGAVHIIYKLVYTRKEQTIVSTIRKPKLKAENRLTYLPVMCG